MSESFNITFFDEKGQPVSSELGNPASWKTEKKSKEVIRTEGGDSNVRVRGAVNFEYKICHVSGVPDSKTEIVYRTVTIWGKKIRIPTVAIRKRTCDTTFVAVFTVESNELVPIVTQCAVIAAVVAASIIIGGLATGPAAFVAGLESFTLTIAECLALKGFERKVFDVALDQRKSCTAWEAVA